MELYRLTAAELSRMIRNKEVSSTEVTKSVFSRIKEKESEIEAYVTLNEEGALKKAAEVDEKIARGENLSSLAGIPVGIKDNICTKGLRTTCSSKMLSNFVPPYNATVINKLEAADFVCTGKLNMDEFAMGSSTETSFFKKTKNPFDTTRVPGGSSGGSAASVASGEAIVALGSDTGGSIRQPASFCGVVGMKPTYGSVSRFGLVAFASSLDQIGPFGRSVEDVAMLTSIICGKDPMDTTSVRREYPRFEDNLSADVKGLRIGIPEVYFGQGVTEEVRQSVMKAAHQYEQMGAVLVPVELPQPDYALAAYYIIACAEASSNLARFDGVKYGYRSPNFTSLEDLYENTRSEGFGEEVKRRIMLGTYVLSSGYYDAYYKKAKFTQNLMQDMFRKAFTQADVILCPTAPDTAFKFGENSDDQVKMYMNDILTVTVNIVGLPAISIPCGFDSKGLPIGCQLIGDKFSEQLLLNTAFAYEKAVGGFDLSRTLA